MDRLDNILNDIDLEEEKNEIKEDYADEIVELEAQLAQLENTGEPETDSFGRPTNDNSAW